MPAVLLTVEVAKMVVSEFREAESAEVATENLQNAFCYHTM